MKFLYEPVEKAARCAVEDLRKDGGIGGVIALDRRGNGMCFTKFSLQLYGSTLFCSGNDTELPRDVSWDHTERWNCQDGDLCG
jgi:hypothetical protein